MGNLTNSPRGPACVQWSHIRVACSFPFATDPANRLSISGCWLEERNPVIQFSTATKRTAILENRIQPTEHWHSAVFPAHIYVKRTPYKCTSECCLDLCKLIQYAPDTHKTFAMCDENLKAYGSRAMETEPVQSFSGISSQTVLERWRDGLITPIHCILPLPILNWPDNQPTLQYLSGSTSLLACGDSPGNDGISPGILTADRATLLLNYFQVEENSIRTSIFHPIDLTWSWYPAFQLWYNWSILPGASC